MSEPFSSILGSTNFDSVTLDSRPHCRASFVAASFGIGLFCIALFFALCPPPVFAQQAEPSPSSAPSSSAPASSQAPLRFPQAQGQAETAALDWVLDNSGPLKGDTQAGDFRIAFTVTPAEGWWDKAADGKLQWHDAPDDNFHLRIFIMDLADGRLVPALGLHALLIDANGNQQAAPVDFGWYPLINAYGANVPLAADSSYILRVTIDPSAPPSSGERTTTVAEFPPIPIAQDDLSHLPLATASASSNEAELMKPLNAALSSSITALWQQSVSAGEKADGDYFVGYALDYSGAAVPLGSAKLRLKNLVEFSGKDDVRFALMVRDSRTGRIIPGLKPQATLVASDGKLYGPGELPLSGDSGLTRYEGHVRISRKGSYILRVHFDAPGFRRWGRSEERFGLPADVEFDELSLKPEKRTTP